MKSNWQYQDATNVVGYYSKTVEVSTDKLSAPLKDFDKGYFTGNRIIIDAAMALSLVQSVADPCKTLWVFRYYDLDDRKFETYGKALVRLVSFIRDLAAIKEPDKPKPKVNVIAHSMGGLLRSVQQGGPERPERRLPMGRPCRQTDLGGVSGHEPHRPGLRPREHQGHGHAPGLLRRRA
jgi:hypothetical protein